MRKTILGIALVLVTSNSYACEKWKGELTKLAWESGKYFKLYNNFKNEGIAKAIFVAETEGIVSEISELSDYVNSTESCAGSKFEKRKERLVSYMGKAIAIMRGGAFITAFKK